MTTDNLQSKITPILSEYALAPNNNSVGSGKGGNVKFLAYTHNKQSQITPEVNDIEIRDNRILWNPEFLSKSKADIRSILDTRINDQIEKEHFSSVWMENDKDPSTIKYNESLLKDEIKNLNIEALLNGDVAMPDLSQLDFTNKLFLCIRVCAQFKALLDTENSSKYYKPFIDIVSKFETPISLFAIRTEINLETLVKYNLDEKEPIGAYLQTLNTMF